MTAPDPAGHVYSLADQDKLGRPGGRPAPRDECVGLFQGARYRTDYYRPSLYCVMRYTNHPQFCPICVDAIRAKLTGG